MWRCSLALLLLAPTCKGLAYSPVRPVRHDIFSRSAAFVLDVDPEAERFTVYASDKRDQPLWGFSSGVWQEKHFLSDDGKVVAIVDWRYVQVDSLNDTVCVEFWNRNGKFREYTYAELCPAPARSYPFEGPVGFFWRKWYSEVESTGDTLRVRTTDEFEYIFALDDGRILETHRIGLPNWAWWAIWIIVGSGIAMLWLRWRRRKNQMARRAALADGGRAAGFARSET